ncbi:MAG TPA: SRPBCC family protein [Flavobacteriales bacterium]|nr:SRPBCC family protein [Flavobacteriales bacterium]HPH83163.1 SRPBCC family protein [Flavobacteriales bacterium]
MRILKKTALIVIAFIAMVLVIALFLPKTYSISRFIEINSSTEVVYNQVSDFSTWKEWDPWSRNDQRVKIQLNGIPGKPGHQRHYMGGEMGEGKMTISACTPYSLLISKIEVTEPATLQFEDIWTFDGTENGTKVTWTSKGDLDYPFGRLYGLMINQLLGNEMADGLDSLKSYTEAMPEEPITNPHELLIEQDHAD